MEVKKILLPILTVLLATNAIPVLAYDNDTTHPALTQEIVEFYNLSFPNDPITDEEREWIIQGSILEDTSPRWINHFYDPVNKVGWTGEEAGKISAEAVRKASILLSIEKPLSAVEWVRNDLVQESYRGLGGNRSWRRGLDYYLDGDEKEFYITLGHILHLLEDMGVPDHTRNDTHAEPLQKITDDPGSPLEKYATGWNRDSINKLGIPQNLIASNTQVPMRNRIEDYLISVAEYSNKYFFSRDTINSPKYQFPKIVREDYNFAYGSDESGGEFPLAAVDFNRNSSGDVIKTYSLAGENEYAPILNAYFLRLSRQIILNGAGVIALYKKEAEDAVVNEEYYAYDILRNRRARSIARFPTIPNFSLFGTVSKAWDIAKSAVAKVGNVLSNATEVITSPVRNLTSKIGGQADLSNSDVAGSDLLPEPAVAPSDVEMAVSFGNDVEVRESEEEGEEDIAAGDAETSESAGEAVSEATSATSQPSPAELAALQAQIDEAARQIESLRRQVQLVVSQAQLARDNSVAFEEQEEEEEEEEEEELEPEIAEVRVYDTSYIGSVGGGGGSSNSESSTGGGGSSSSGGGSSSSASTDTTAPGVIADLVVSSTTASSITLSWTAPGDDGTSGTAASYIIRYATTTITDSNWPSAADFSSPPTPLAAGTSQSVLIAGLTPGTTYYFAIKAKDEEGNESELSNIVSAVTALPPPDTSNVNHVLISEVQVAGADAGDEFIELYNPTESEIDISDWSIQYLSGSASSTAGAVKKNFESGNTIGARSYFLIARGLNASGTDGYVGSRTPDLLHRTFSLSGASKGATIFLVKNQEIISDDSDVDIVDRLAYGSGTGLVAETSPAPLPPAGQSLERKAWASGACASATGANEYSGNGCDTGNNSSDFEIRSVPNPQNLANLPEPRSAPQILNFSASYSSSTMSVDFSWTPSPDARGATSTITYEIKEYASSGKVIFNGKSTAAFSKRIYEVGREYDFGIVAKDSDGLSSEEIRKQVSVPSFINALYFYEDTREGSDSRYLLDVYYSDFPYIPHIFADRTSAWQGLVFYLNRPANVENRSLDTALGHAPADREGVLPVVWRTCAGGGFGLPKYSLIFAVSSEWCTGIGGGLHNTSSGLGQSEDLHFLLATASTTSQIVFTEEDYVTVAFYDFEDSGFGNQKLGLVAVDVTEYHFQRDFSHQKPPEMQGEISFDFDGLDKILTVSWEAATDQDTADSLLSYEINFSPLGEGLNENLWEEVGAREYKYKRSVDIGDAFLIGVRARDDFGNVSQPLVAEWEFPANFNPLEWGGILEQTFTIACGHAGNCTTDGEPKSAEITHDLGVAMEIESITVTALLSTSGATQNCNDNRRFRAVVLDVGGREIAATNSSGRDLCASGVETTQTLAFPAGAVAIPQEIKLRFENAGGMARGAVYIIKNVKLRRLRN